MSLLSRRVPDEPRRIAGIIKKSGFDGCRVFKPLKGRLTHLIELYLSLFIMTSVLISCEADPDITPSTLLKTSGIEPMITLTTSGAATTRLPSLITPTFTESSPTNTHAISPTAPATELPVVDMVIVEAGEFLMGSTETDKDAKSDERPQHKIFLESYFIDRTEVTNAMYKACVDAGACTPPVQTNSLTHLDYYSNHEFDEFPVIHVNWNQALAYCRWRKARLPTEAEWEKAARGTDGRTYPWGEEIDCTRANYGGSNGCVADTAEVGSYPDSASPYGLLDMSGNVLEWVNDWYLDNFYETSPLKYPKGPSSGERRIARGGSWNSPDNLLRVATRQYFAPSTANAYIGLRCARSE
jgi:formylglycine-generating enzyme required for sulfatase activity